MNINGILAGSTNLMDNLIQLNLLLQMDRIEVGRSTDQLKECVPFLQGM